MNDEKRMAGDYEITQAIHVGDKEIVFGVDEKNENPYFCAFYQRNDLLEQYSECMIGNDYAEMVGIYAHRIEEQGNRLKEERSSVTVPMEPITAEQCIPDDYKKSIEGKVIVIRPDVLRPEYQTADRQLWLCRGGFGAHANSRGNACFCVNLYNGKESRWERYDIQGEIRPEHMPDWAKERLSTIQKEPTKKEERHSTDKEAR